MKIHFFKYQGAGNDFVVIDNRQMSYKADIISHNAFLCDRRFGIGGDGLILLQEHPGYDFGMRYFNSDGREASMCGNGGRCIVAFANKLGLINSAAAFMAVDGLHEAHMEADGTVNLKMSDVKDVEVLGEEYFLNTGSPHFVRFMETLEGLDVDAEGRAVRYNERFRKEGTNVNFVKFRDEQLTVYTYERGVEAETLACGTGITASALCAALRSGLQKGTYPVTAKGGNLSVSFERHGTGFRNIWLRGPASFVFEGFITL